MALHDPKPEPKPDPEPKESPGAVGERVQVLLYLDFLRDCMSETADNLGTQELEAVQAIMNGPHKEGLMALSACAVLRQAIKDIMDREHHGPAAMQHILLKMLEGLLSGAIIAKVEPDPDNDGNRGDEAG